MNNTDWVKKLTSRKFWVTIVGFVTPLMIAYGCSEAEATRVAGLIMSGASVVAYIIGEGLVDASSASANTTSVCSNTITSLKDTTTSTDTEEK